MERSGSVTFTEPAMLWLAGTVMGEVGTRNTKPVILWLAGTVMIEVGALTFHGAGNTVVGWHGYW